MRSRAPRNLWHVCLCGSLILSTSLPAISKTIEEDRAEGDAFFEKEIRPLLSENCWGCHGEEKTRGGLRLTARETILSGGETGPAIVPGKPDGSLLIRAISYTGDLKMPPKTKLSDPQIAALTKWVQMGAPWPGPSTASSQPTATSAPAITDAQRQFWSFQKPQATPPPMVKQTEWPRSDIDRFILSKLEERGLAPAPPADKRTLIRRATFDLIGLPPSPQDIDAFLADNSPDAFAKVVDRLLAAPQYGQRWARHWLDVVRYTDSFDSRVLAGDARIMDASEAWRFRDWVVKAFNDDMPYDQFVIHQIAGDLLPSPTPDTVNTDGIIATGMLAIGNWGGGDADKEKLLTDIADDQVDVVSRAFLGLTVACARCHDHKFDPISTEDYYGLAGIFFSSHILKDVGPKTNGPPMLRIPLASKAQIERRERQIKRIAELETELQKQQDQARLQVARQLAPQSGDYLMAAALAIRGQDIDSTAAQHKLDPRTLSRWVEYLSRSDLRLLSTPVRDLLSNPGLHAWRGSADTPSVVVNSTEKEIAFLSIRMPPRTVAVHPSPSGPVGVAWISPIRGRVRITGRVFDVDVSCGDGVDWKLTVNSSSGDQPLLTGMIPNGGSQDFLSAQTAKAELTIDINSGQRLTLLVSPHGDYSCDSTGVAFKIVSEATPAQVWDLTSDVTPDPLAMGNGNPHGDAYGHRGVWCFFDAAEPREDFTSMLACWHTAIRSAAQPGANVNRLTDCAVALDELVRVALQSVNKATTQPADVKTALPDLLTFLASNAGPFGSGDLDPTEGAPGNYASLAAMRAELKQLKETLPPEPEFANGVQEGGVPDSPQAGIHDVKIHIRGKYDRLGKLVPRHFPRVIAFDDQPPIGEGSGRIQLARWITQPDHPLTARVFVNRLWQHHFGAGLVRTPGNFGKLGRPPTHPELLDDLALRFVASGWSIKTMHRAIMLSAAYQQSSIGRPETIAADPDNLLFGRMNRQRLEAEPLRDALLAVAGKLDATSGGPAFRELTAPRRTLYLMTVRSDRANFRQLFDAADPTALIDERIVSTVAPQALFLMNNPFAIEMAGQLAERILKEDPSDSAAQIARLYLLLFGRPPLPAEVEIGLKTLRTDSADPKQRMAALQRYSQILICSNEFIYID